MNLPKNKAVSIASALIFSVLLLVVGCSESPVGVDSDSRPVLVSRNMEASALGQMSDVPLYTEAVVSAEQGGVLQLYDVRLDIPAGAIDNDTLFFINIPDVNVFYNEFGTHGLVFNEPVRVTMSYREANLNGLDETTIRIGWWNEAMGEFQDVECEIDFASKTVTGYLNHFSAYALISDEQ